MTTNQNDNNLLVRIGILDDKGEPNVIPLAYYFNTTHNKIYINTLQTTLLHTCLDGNRHPLPISSDLQLPGVGCYLYCQYD